MKVQHIPDDLVLPTLTEEQKTLLTEQFTQEDVPDTFRSVGKNKSQSLMG